MVQPPSIVLYLYLCVFSLCLFSILDYLSNVQKSAKQHAVYETIITLGNVDEHPEPHESYEILQQVYGEWKKNYPNLAVVGAYFHADEKGAPHIHIDYVPIAHGYKKGMAVQNGLVKAFGEMGFILKGKDTAQIQWQRDLKSRVTELAKERGFEVIEPTVKRKKHVETAFYKLEKQVPTLRDERNKLYGDVARAQEALYEANKPFRDIEHLECRLEAVEAKYEALRDYVAGFNFKGVNLLERFDHEEAEKASSHCQKESMVARKCNTNAHHAHYRRYNSVLAAIQYQSGAINHLSLQVVGHHQTSSNYQSRWQKHTSLSHSRFYETFQCSL